jgi:proteasome lid subunit RPN8/RPN11
MLTTETRKQKTALQDIAKAAIREHHWYHPHPGWRWPSTIDHRLQKHNVSKARKNK